MNLIQDMIGKKIVLDGKLLAVQEIEQHFCVAEKPVYEVIRVIDGIPLFFEDHMERMRNSCALTGMTGLPDDALIRAWIAELCRENCIYYNNVKLIAGIADNSLMLLVYLLRTSYPAQESYLEGVATDMVDWERDNPAAKILNVAYKKSMNRIMSETDAYELLLVNEEGLITEGSKSNVFFIKGNTVMTAEAKYVLSGITRHHVMQACRQAGAVVLENALLVDELPKVDAVFLSGTSPRVLPVSSVGDLQFASSSNPMLKAIAAEYDAMILAYIEARGGRTSFETDSI